MLYKLYLIQELSWAVSMDNTQPIKAPARLLGPLASVFSSGNNRSFNAFKRDGLAVASLIILVIIIAASIFAPWLTPYAEQGAGVPNILDKFEPPSSKYWWGTDQLGRDVLARVLYGGRTSLFAAFGIVFLALISGTLLGAVAGYVGGWLDEVIMRITDIFLAFPPLLLAITIAAVLEPNLRNTIIAVALTWWPWYTRIARGQAISLRERAFVQAAQGLGASNFSIIQKHVVPNLMTPVLVQATLDLGTAIMTVTGLSFLGIGVQAPTADWGVMVNEGRLFVQSGIWWVATFPGLMIFVSTLAFNLLGDSIQIVLNPKTRRA